MTLLDEHGNEIPAEPEKRYIFKPQRVLNLVEVTEFFNLLGISFNESVLEGLSTRLQQHFISLADEEEVFNLPQDDKMNGSGE